ncbi:MAG: hypothetical protein FWD63_00085 [Propionibacteriaceae bacterium]|nr:hypothetical protein [Propionibacteriaceae bacterium]
MATDSADSASKGSSIGNFLKAILLVALAIVLLRLLGGVISWLFGVIITAVVIVVLGVFIFGVINAFKKR